MPSAFGTELEREPLDTVEDPSTYGMEGSSCPPSPGARRRSHSTATSGHPSFRSAIQKAPHVGDLTIPVLAFLTRTSPVNPRHWRKSISAAKMPPDG